MFDLNWNTPGPHIMNTRPHSNMPVDFAAYLLAASPPGFGFYAGPSPLYQGFNEPSRQQCDSNDDMAVTKNIQSEQDNRVCGFSLVEESNVNDTDMDSLTRSFLDYCKVRDKPGMLDLQEEDRCERDDEIGSCGSSLVSSSSGNTTPRSRPDSPRSPASPGGKGLRKKVSFADDLGLALENIRIMTEPSDTPPRLKPDVFQTLRNDAQAGVTEVPPLVLNFSQPASDYVEFRRRIEHDCVCLENVIIRDYNIMGTIKVKNINFEKSVFVRCTFDGWKSEQDIQTTYVPNSSSVSHFDTFSFTMNVSKSLGTKDKMEFCVCYTCADQQFWDNNKGSNYVVVTSDWKDSSTSLKNEFRDDNAVFSLSTNEDWSLYSSWTHRDSSIPYY